MEADSTEDSLAARLDKLWGEERRLQHLDDPLAEGAPLAEGRRLGKYELIRVLGRGSFGVVYHARDTQLDREVALKLPRPEVLLDEERLSRFHGEATLTASLDHPLIVPVYEAELSSPTPYIASAYCTGLDLKKWLEGQNRPVDPEDAAAFVADLADAVHYAHSRGVLHRDLKPANILLEPNERGAPIGRLTDCEPRLTDFGLARLLEGTLHDTRASVLVGTPLYMAPEQLVERTGEAAATIDVYALGVLLYELLSLRTPFEGATYVEVVDSLRGSKQVSVRDANPGTPRDLEIICDTCLSREPSDRYDSATALRDDLERYLHGEPIKARAMTVFDRFARWTQRKERLKQAGLFTCWFQSLAMLWMLGVLLVGAFKPIFPEGTFAKSVADTGFMAVTLHVPLLLLGWQMLRGRFWAFLPGAAFSGVLVVVFIYSATQPAITFEYNYLTPLSKVNTYVALIIGALLQAAAYAVATPAWLRTR